MGLLQRTILTMVLAVAVCGPALSDPASPTISDAALNAVRGVTSGSDESGKSPPPEGSGIRESVNAPPAPQTIQRDPEPITPPPEHRLNVMLDWYLNPYHAALIVAQERGLFAREGLEVTLTIPADPSVPPKLVAAQRTELAVTSEPRLHLLVDQGLPLVRVGTLVPLPLGTLLVRKDSGIASLSHLKGKKVGYALEDQARLLLDGMLTNQPVSTDELTLERVDFAMARSLIEKKVDAVIGALRHLEQRQMAQEGVAALEFPVEEQGVPLYDEMILIANRNVLKQHRRDIAHFLDAVQSATLWLVNHPEAAWELVRRARPTLDTESNAQSWQNMLRYLALRPAALQSKRYATFESYLHERGLIGSVVPVERLAVDVSTP